MNTVLVPQPPALSQRVLQVHEAIESATPVAGLAMTARSCVEQTAELLRLACRRGQLEDAAAAARVALRLAEPHSPHQAMLRALADAQPALMCPPGEDRLYLLRDADGRRQDLLRLRDSGQVCLSPPAHASRWALHAGNLELHDTQGRATARFPLCGRRGALRLYLGQSLDDGTPRLLQELRCTYTRLSMLDPELVEPLCGLYDTDAMVPAELPARAALLLGTPHSGVDRLAGLLNRSGDVFIDGALLHPQGIRLAEGALPAAPTSALHAMRAKDPAWFARMMLARGHDAAGRDLDTYAVRGFRLAPADSPVALDWAITEPALRIVLVTRSNLLAEFADGLADSRPGHALHFDGERFARFVEIKHRHLAALRDRLSRRNGDTVEVDGSRLNPATMAALRGFLTDRDEVAAPALSGADDIPAGRPIDRFENPAMVQACLASLGQPDWAEAEYA
jgi:hypothetical protein